jgi:hypothetical protein
MTDEIIHFNVGGQFHSITRSVLVKDQSTLFYKWFSNEKENPLERDEEGRYFIDRDGSTISCIRTIFCIILEIL